MSRALLEFGGSGDIQRDVLNGFPETELLVTGASRGDQLRHDGMTLQAPEALDGFEDAEHGRDGLPQGFRDIEDHEQTAIGAESPVLQILE
jgi:hypothetical protein